MVHWVCLESFCLPIFCSHQLSSLCGWVVDCLSIPLMDWICLTKKPGQSGCLWWFVLTGGSTCVECQVFHQRFLEVPKPRWNKEGLMRPRLRPKLRLTPSQWAMPLVPQELEAWVKVSLGQEVPTCKGRRMKHLLMFCVFVHRLSRNCKGNMSCWSRFGAWAKAGVCWWKQDFNWFDCVDHVDDEAVGDQGHGQSVHDSW